jgi:hypothetical protein
MASVSFNAGANNDIDDAVLGVGEPHLARGTFVAENKTKPTTRSVAKHIAASQGRGKA